MGFDLGQSPRTKAVPMFEMGHFRKSAVVSARSVLPSGTDIISRAGHVRKVPDTDMAIRPSISNKTGVSALRQ
jgi:hypothetical protein